MKKIILKSLLLVATFLFVEMMNAQQWQTLQTGVTDDLYNICCIDENTIFVCGQNGVVLKSEDGGATWQEKYRNPNWEIFSMKFADENVGYGLALKNEYEILQIKTIDSGESWQCVNTSASRDNDPLELFTAGKPAELFVLNADTIYVRLYEVISRSIDGGLTFDNYELGYSPYTGGMGDNEGIRGEYFEDNYGWVIGYDEGNQNTLRVMRTEDCGNNWENIANYEFSECKIAAYHGDGRCAKIYGEFIGYNGSKISYNMIETNDGFEHVTMSKSDGFDCWSQYSDVDFISQERGCFINSSNIDELYNDSHAYITDDYGMSWTEVPFGFNNRMFLYSVAATNSTFLISSQQGRLYKYDDSPIQGIEENDTEASVFPNPVKDIFIIHFAKEADCQLIEIHSIDGRLVETFPETSPATSIDISNLTPGIFFLKVKTTDGKEYTERIVKE